MCHIWGPSAVAALPCGSGPVGLVPPGGRDILGQAQRSTACPSPHWRLAMAPGLRPAATLGGAGQGAGSPGSTGGRVWALCPAAGACTLQSGVCPHPAGPRVLAPEGLLLGAWEGPLAFRSGVLVGSSRNMSTCIKAPVGRLHAALWVLRPWPSPSSALDLDLMGSQSGTQLFEEKS